MNLYTLDNIKYKNEDGLYDLFDNRVAPEYFQIRTISYLVMPEDAMRLDLICVRVYGNCDYLDEIMTLNGITDPLAINEGDTLIMFEPADITLLYAKSVNERETEIALAVKNKETTKDPNRQKELQLPPSAKRGLSSAISAADGTFNITNKP